VGHLGQHHARVLAGLPGVQLAGVADANAEQAHAIGEKHGCPAYTDFRALLGRVDAVSVAVPTTLHREVASAFMDHGIPALVEKPLAGSLAEAEDLVRLARRRGVLLQVGHIERFNPALGAIESLRPRPKFIAAERMGVYTCRSTDIGVVLDLMIHDIDLVLSWVEAPLKSVSAVGLSLFGCHEDVANARLEFADGCVANLSASRASFQAVRKMWLWAPEGFAALDFAARKATIVRPSDRARRGELDLAGVDFAKPDQVREHLFKNMFPLEQFEPAGAEPLAVELEEFVRSVQTGSRPRATGDDALRAMRVADQVLHSINTHTWDGHSEGPIGPRELPEAALRELPEQPTSPVSSAIPAPKLLRYKSTRSEPAAPADS
jgi:predicted dehydrogenase